MNWRFVSLLVCAALLAAGCDEDNPDRCPDQTSCPGQVCHPTKFYCYDGCKSDEDCKDTTSRAYVAGAHTCNPTTKLCEGGDGGVGDGGSDASDLPNGSKCGSASNCKSGNCVDGVCCDTACQGACLSCSVSGSEGVCTNVPVGDDPRGDCDPSKSADCKGSCDGNGACTFPGNSKSCGTATCQAGKGQNQEDVLAEKHCDGKGACADKPAPTSCGGYVCSAGKCGDKPCSGGSDCTGTYQCVSTECKNNLPDGANCGGNDKACKSGKCVDGVCCKTACDGTCEQCEPGTGTCKAIAAGTDPHTECNPSSDNTCKGTCDGNGGSGAGKCNFPSTTTCNKQCAGTATNPTLETFACDGAGACATTGAQSTSCNFSKCTGTGTAAKCTDGCATKADCVAGSLCDRTQAHTNGRGTCIDPAKVVSVTGTIQAAIAAATATQTHVLIPAGTYNEKLTISKNITLVGDGAVTIGTVSGTIVSIGSGIQLALQGVTLDTASAGGNGVECVASSSNRSSLSIVESTIAGCSGGGISATNCDVVLRRNTIRNNQGGGLSLANGKFTVVNNVIVSNGGISSTVGGALLSPTSATGNVFAHNTVAGNDAIGSGKGVKCNAPTTLASSIIWSNGATPLTADCSPTNSDVEGLTPLTNGNINQAPQFNNLASQDFSLKTTSPCIDKGSTNPSGGTVIDFTGGGRKKGAATDIGAYEIR